jgi:hypothetical protein
MSRDFRLRFFFLVQTTSAGSNRHAQNGFQGVVRVVNEVLSRHVKWDQEKLLNEKYKRKKYFSVVTSSISTFFPLILLTCLKV